MQSLRMYLNALTKRWFIFTYKGLIIWRSGSDATLTLKTKNIVHAFTNRFACIFESTFVLSHSRSQRSFRLTEFHPHDICFSKHILLSSFINFSSCAHNSSYIHFQFLFHTFYFSFFSVPFLFFIWRVSIFHSTMG